MKIITHMQVYYKSIVICFIMCCLITLPMFGNIVKLNLVTQRDCGVLEMGVYIKASDLVQGQPAFGIGSSSIFFNYNEAIVSYQSFQPAEFSAGTSGQAAGANWLDQSWDVNYSNGILNLVLQKEPGGTYDYLLDVGNWIHIGTISFDWLGIEADPEIRVNDIFTVFNAPGNDGLELRGLEDYPVVTDWSGTNKPILTQTTQHVWCFGGFDGFTSVTATNGTPPYSFEWNTGATTPSINVSVGVYQVTVTDSNGCSAVSSTMITEPTALNVAAFVNANACNTAVAAANGGTPPYMFYWDNGETTAQAIALSPGLHNVMIIDGNGCAKNASVTISECEDPYDCIVEEDDEVFHYGADFSVNGSAFSNPVSIPNAFTQATFVSNQQLKIYFRTLGISCENDVEIKVTDPNGAEFIFGNLFLTNYCSFFQLHSTVIDVPAAVIPSGNDWKIEFRDVLNQNNGPEYSMRHIQFTYDYAVLASLTDDCDLDGVINAEDPNPLDPCINGMPTDEYIQEVFDQDFFVDGVGYENNPEISFDFPVGYAHAAISNVTLQLFMRVEMGSCQNDIDVRVVQPNGDIQEFQEVLGGPCSTNYPLYATTINIPNHDVLQPDSWLLQFNDSDDQLPGNEFSLRAAIIRYDYVLQNVSTEDCTGAKKGTRMFSATPTNPQSIIQIFPNPAIDQVNVQSMTEFDIVKIRLFDLSGKEMLSTQQTDIDVSGFAGGVYLVNVDLSNGISVSKRLVITD